MIDRLMKTTAFCLTLILTLFACFGAMVESGLAAEEPQGEPFEPIPYLRPLTQGKAGAPAFESGKLSFDRDQTIALLGGTNALEMQRYGYLETLLAMTHPDLRLRVRNLAWQADTVYRQQRPRHFFQPAPIRYPGDADGREPIPVDTIIFWMGQSESLEGVERLGDFRDAYNAMLDQLVTITPRIVLITPVLFEKTKEIPLDIGARNKTVVAYAAAIKQIGEERQLPVVDLLTAILLRTTGRPDGLNFTRNGMHLSSYGSFAAALSFSKAAGGQQGEPAITGPDATGEVKPAGIEAVRQQVLKKDELWYRYWRPTNWAFLYGNRSLQPSSRDHTDNKKRWFPKEVASIVPLIEQRDELIHQAAREYTFRRDNDGGK